MWWQLNTTQIIGMVIFVVCCGLGSIGGYFLGKLLNQGQADSIRSKNALGETEVQNLIPMAVLLGIGLGAIVGTAISFGIKRWS
jgi:hypothetical protein